MLTSLGGRPTWLALAGTPGGAFDVARAAGRVAWPRRADGLARPGWLDLVSTGSKWPARPAWLAPVAPTGLARPGWLDLASIGSIWLPWAPWLPRFGCPDHSRTLWLARLGCLRLPGLPWLARFASPECPGSPGLARFGCSGRRGSP